MTPEEEVRFRGLVARAWDLPAHERNALIEEACKADAEIGARVRGFFAIANSTQDDLERPAFRHVEAYYERLSGRPAFCKHGRNGIA